MYKWSTYSRLEYFQQLQKITRNATGADIQEEIAHQRWNLDGDDIVVPFNSIILYS